VFKLARINKKISAMVSLPAVRGIQAGMEYYVVMCPIDYVVKLFQYTDDSLSPIMRAQRTLNKQRIPEIRDYVLNNPSTYVFSALTASVDGNIEFEESSDYRFGFLKIGSGTRIIINDGQHRREALQEALKKNPKLKDEDISIVMYYDLGLKRSQQMFTDLNRHAVRPTMSLNILYDNRDPFATLIKECIEEISIFKDRVEMEKSTISNRSKALFTLSGIYHATKDLLFNLNILEQDMKMIIIYFWNTAAENILPWINAMNGKISSEDFRREYICAHSIALKALGAAGNQCIKKNPETWHKVLTNLEQIDWRKENKEFEGIVLVNGRISSSRNNQAALTQYIMDKLGISPIIERKYHD
jgi:DNA sulfur modification protein DndB